MAWFPARLLNLQVIQRVRNDNGNRCGKVSEAPQDVKSNADADDWISTAAPRNKGIREGTRRNGHRYGIEVQ